MIARLLSRFRRPAHVCRFGDYTADWTFTPCWSPDGLELR